jgi:hypothetical protein
LNLTEEVWQPAAETETQESIPAKVEVTQQPPQQIFSSG